MTAETESPFETLIDSACQHNEPGVEVLLGLAIISKQLGQLVEAEQVKADRDRDLHITLAEIHQRLFEIRNKQ